jgi:hypothetical protein
MEAMNSTEIKGKTISESGHKKSAPEGCTLFIFTQKNPPHEENLIFREIGGNVEGTIETALGTSKN